MILVIKRSLVLLPLLLISFAAHAMTVERIKPNEELLKKLIKFHDATSSSEFSAKPDLNNFKKQNKFFVAKMDSFGLDRYFSFQTNDDVEALVKAVQNGCGMNVAWYYYEEETSSNSEPKALEPNVVNISGLDKVEILRALYAKAKPLGMGFRAFVQGDLDYREAQETLEADSYIDYLKGRAMKVDLSGDTLNTRLFNRDNGDGAAESAIEQLRSAKK